MEDDFIPDAQFTPDPKPVVQASPQPQGGDTSPDFIPDSQFQSDEQKYTSLPQQTLAGIEGLGQGFAGPLATLGERMGGVNPEEMRARAQYNPWTHGIAEAAGFGLGSLTGASEAGALAKAGEGVVGLTGLGGEGASVASRLAAGSAKMATEMGLFQAGDEASKAILSDPSQTVGSAASNIGLSSLLGGVAGIPLTGIGIGAKAAMNSQLLKDFTERLGFRAANINPNEMMQHELAQGINSFDQIGDEVNGFGGLKSQAIKNLLPEQMTPEIESHLNDVSAAAQGALKHMGKEDVPARLIKDFQSTTNRFLETATNPEASVGDHFDALNQFKNDLQDYSKGRYGILAPQRTAEDYQFLKATKQLAYDVKTGLENEGIWGDAASVQKDINKAWSESIPAVKDVTKKFMSRVGNEYVVDPQKFITYMNQNGKATSTTIKQQMMGKFVDAMDQFHSTVANVAEKAGIENPIDPIGLTALRDSIEKQSVGSKLADVWHDKLSAYTAGNALGGGIGGLAGHATGIPEAGIAGAYLGRWTLGPVFSAIIKPLMENGINIPGVKNTFSFLNAAVKGNSDAVNMAAHVFGNATKTIPSHFMPSHDQIQKLDKQIESSAADPKKLFDTAGNLGKYLPDHAQAVAQTTSNAVNYLNSLRPSNPKMNPLDSEIPVSKTQLQPFHRSLSIAEQPLQIFTHIKNGSLLPQDVTTLKNVYPDFYNKMSQDLTNAMINHISKDGTVPYRIKQSMSLFLGQPMDSTMTPQSMQSIQSIYAQGKQAPQPQQPSGKSKGSPSKLSKMSNNLRTSEQARMDRANQG